MDWSMDTPRHQVIFRISFRQNERPNQYTTKKKKKSGQKTAIITDPEFTEKPRKIKEKEEREKQKQPIKTKNCTRKKINYQAPESNESEIEIESENDWIIWKWRFSREKQSNWNVNKKYRYWIIDAVFVKVNFITKDDILQQWYGCIYQEYNKIKGSKKQALFFAKTTIRFLNGKAYALKRENLKPETGSRTILESVPQYVGWCILLTLSKT